MKYLLLILFIFLSFGLSSQNLPAGFPILEEFARRSQIESDQESSSFLLRPLMLGGSFDSLFSGYLVNTKLVSVEILPSLSTSRFLTNRPYGWADYGVIPNPGIQSYLSTGIEVKNKFFNLTFRPEVVYSQNGGFQSGIEELPTSEIVNRFFYWNRGDFPERFGSGPFSKFWWGQSKLTLKYGVFETGISTQNIWWGPGQFNSLTFSNNAQGFPHLTFNTSKPAKTFLGNFEGQIIMGRLENSGFGGSQNQQLNDRFFTPFSGDWRYLNAISISWSPKWINGFFVGFSRTFQQYNATRDNSFGDLFPIFEGLQKRQFFENGNTIEFDSDGRDQTVTFFGRLVIPKTKSEVYFEFGKRDHSLNWREFILNPEHARAFIFGFNQLIDLSQIGKSLHIRSEITHQQESVNRLIRYPGIRGGQTWHTHNAARGFVNYGQALGVGIGPGSNVQTIEFSLVEDLNKVGVFFERLANNQDFYYKAQFQFTERKPWIDLSLGFLYDKQFNNLLLSSKLQLIHARNYQWQLHPDSTPLFPKGQNLTSMMAQVSAIYFWNKKK